MFWSYRYLNIRTSTSTPRQSFSTSVSRHYYLHFGPAHRHLYLDIFISTFVSRHRYLNIDPDLDIDTSTSKSCHLQLDIGFSTSIRTSTSSQGARVPKTCCQGCFYWLCLFVPRSEHTCIPHAAILHTSRLHGLLQAYAAPAPTPPPRWRKKRALQSRLCHQRQTASGEWDKYTYTCIHIHTYACIYLHIQYHIHTCMHTYMHVHTCILHVYVHARTYTYKCIHMHTCTCVYIHMHEDVLCICIYTCVRIHRPAHAYTFIGMIACVCVCIYIIYIYNTYMHTCICIYACIYIYIYICVCMYA